MYLTMRWLSVRYESINFTLPFSLSVSRQCPRKQQEENIVFPIASPAAPNVVSAPLFQNWKSKTKYGIIAKPKFLYVLEVNLLDRIKRPHRLAWEPKHCMASLSGGVTPSLPRNSLVNDNSVIVFGKIIVARPMPAKTLPITNWITLSPIVDYDQLSRKVEFEEGTKNTTSKQ